MTKAGLPLFAIVAFVLMPSMAHAQSEAYFVLKQSPNNSTFIFKLTDPTKIQEARNIIATHAQKIVGGTIIKQGVYYNPNWHFHFDPRTISFADVGIELCDAAMEGIEADIDNAWTTWCPWNGVVVLASPPPPNPGTGNLKPTVSVTMPYRNDSINPTSPVNVFVDINADDPDGAVTKVEVFNQSIKIGELSSAPYRFNWTNLPPGTQSIYAVATDNEGASTTSKTVTFTVKLPVLGNLLDETDFFVRQHYRDFLNREPDDAGLQFWKNNIDGCGPDAACREVKRIDTSAAFFLSIEFQETGYFVHRFYKASFGRRPMLFELQPDSRVVGKGLIVNAPGWQDLLASNKRTFAEAWVTRSSFASIYDPLTNTQYVDLLLNNSGAIFPTLDRDAWVSALNTNAKSRAAVLFEVVESREFYDGELSTAFVEMEYFGYLRRNPQDPPDNDLVGYNFWLDKLNQSHGNYLAAEMVKAFLSSIEYRQRFGQ